MQTVRLSDAATNEQIIAAIEDSFVNYITMIVATAGGITHRDSLLTGVWYRHPLMYSNGILSSSIPESLIDSTIIEQRQRYLDSHKTMLWWIVPRKDNTILANHLEQHGFTFAWTDIGMAAHMKEIPDSVPMAPGFTIEKVLELSQLEEWLAAYSAGFGMSEDVQRYMRDQYACVPPSDHPIDAFFLGRLHGKPVATSVLFCSSGVAGIYEICTLPEARKLGIGAAMTLAALQAGKSMGYEIATIHASKMGEPVYQRVGFTTYTGLAAYRYTAE